MYQTNLLHWNALTLGRPGLPLIPPIADPDEIRPELGEINELFRLAFYVLADIENGEGFTGAPSSTKQTGGSMSSRSIVRVNVTAEGSESDPYVYGLLLNRFGWVVTLQHPFSEENIDMEEAYLSSRDGEGRYPMVYRFLQTDTNLLLARFALPETGGSVFSGQGPDSAPFEETVPLSEALPRFRAAVKETSAWVDMGESRVPLTVADTDRVLSLSNNRVYENNIVTNAPLALRGLRSGTPLYAADGAILGLFYQRSLDGMTGGFVSIEELPRQIGHAVADLLVISTRGEPQ